MKKALYVFTAFIMLASFINAQQKDFSQVNTNEKHAVVYGPALEETLSSLSESFEGATFPPAGWVKYNPDGGSGWYQLAVGTTPVPGFQGGEILPVPNGNGGSKVVFSNYQTGGASSNNQWLVTPQIVNVAANATLDFWYRKFGSYIDNLDIKISTTNNQMASFSSLQTFNLTADDSGWQNINISLASYAGQSIYIAFNEYVANNQADGASFCLDLVEVTGANVPVELTAFAARQLDGTVMLDWATATETNNSGFSVERSVDNVSFTKIAFVNGNGTTTERKVYSYTDNTVNSGKYYYRLKQVDFDGSFSYSNAIEVSVGVPSEFSLSQNYPNPFNPSTTIKFALPTTSNVKITIYNTIGKEVATLVNGTMEAGTHSAVWNASNNASGMYFFKIEAGNFTATKKMMLIK